MAELEAFEPVVIRRAPSVVLYRNGTYRSDRTYLDDAGDRWVYAGLLDNDPMWRRENEQTAWVLNDVVDQFGPLTEEAS